ncbi:MAG: lysine-2,3-aminomutase-like protein [Hyphomicrobiaceae bacterium]
MADLVAAGFVTPQAGAALQPVAERYAIAISPAMAALIADAGPDDPIARQFVPDLRELETQPQELADPIGDGAHEKVPGLIHRYPDRALLKVTHACPVYCRFCFRREMVGPGGPPPMTGSTLDAALAYIAKTPQIFEVILTGGDPLVLAPRRIAEITHRLGQISSLKIVRWHTRVPVVSPDRMTDDLVAALQSTSQMVYVAIHTNHPRELTAAAAAAIARLRAAGLILISQTVLLKGINANAETLAQLFRALVAQGVKPYYLHHADLAPGTAHFRTTIAEGQAIMQALRGRISGLALPTYVLDIPGGHGKVPIGPSYVAPDSDTITDNAGHPHPYPPPTQD